MADSTLYAVSPTAATPIAALNSNDRCSYDVLNGNVVVGNRTTLILVSGSTARPIGVPDGVLPLVSASSMGGMRGGRYSLAASYVRGKEEGALSGLASLELQEGQGIRIDGLNPPAGVDLV
ncbi:hypothetical protein, partial [Dyella japonica]|uniref:hypothetical protein n=1 Tax=Dyella japonica TaxID=231455 RepID=UPI0012DFEB9A